MSSRREIRKVGEDPILGHSPAGIKHIIQSDPRALDAGLSAPDSGVHRNSLLPVHADFTAVASKALADFGSMR